MKLTTPTRVSSRRGRNPCRFQSVQVSDGSIGDMRFAVGTYHLLALLAFVPWFFSATGVALAVVGVYVFGAAGMNLCYHRLLTHRSFSCPLWLEHTFAIIAVCCVEDTPARWVATHRLHHHRSDERADPHSPLVNLFWSHIGWLFLENTDLGRNVAYDRYARDIIRDSFYRWIERYRGVDHAGPVGGVFCGGLFDRTGCSAARSVRRFNSARASGSGASSSEPFWSGMSPGA